MQPFGAILLHEIFLIFIPLKTPSIARPLTFQQRFFVVYFFSLVHSLGYDSVSVDYCSGSGLKTKKAVITNATNDRQLRTLSNTERTNVYCHNESTLFLLYFPFGARVCVCVRVYCIMYVLKRTHILCAQDVARIFPRLICN